MVVLAKGSITEPNALAPHIDLMTLDYEEIYEI